MLITEADLELKGYRIGIASCEEFSTHQFLTLPEDLCQQMCNVVDHGAQYSNSSRFIYSTDICSSLKGIQFGTARAAVLSSIIKHFGEPVRYLNICPIL